MHGFAGGSLPKLFTVFPLPPGGVEFQDDVGVVFGADPVEEVASHAITAIVSCISQIASPYFRAFGLRFIKIPADVIGNAFGQPVGHSSGIGIITAANLSVILHHVNHLVNDRAPRLAFQFLPEPAGIAIDETVARRRRNIVPHVVAKLNGHIRSRRKSIARQHRDELRIPLLNNRPQLSVRPFGQIRRDGRIDGKTIFASISVEALRDRPHILRCSRGDFRRVTVDDIDLAVKRVAKWIRCFCAENIEQQIAIFANRPARIRNAHSILAALFALLWPRIDGRDQFPSGLCRCCSSLWLGFESVFLSIAGVKFVNLRATRARMPRVSVDLFDLNGVGEIDQQAASIGVLCEEKILGRLIPFRRKSSILKLAQAAAVLVPRTIHECEFGRCSGVAFHGRGDLFESESPRRAVG